MKLSAYDVGLLPSWDDRNTSGRYVEVEDQQTGQLLCIIDPEFGTEGTWAIRLQVGSFPTKEAAVGWLFAHAETLRTARSVLADGHTA